MIQIRTNKAAMEIMTEPQARAIARLADHRDSHLDRLVVQAGGMGLPNGYLAFVQFWVEGQPIYGGISPEGDVST